MIVCKGYPSAIITQGYAAPGGTVTPIEDNGRGSRDWRDGPRPWWWRKNISPKLSQPVEASPQP